MTHARATDNAHPHADPRFTVRASHRSTYRNRSRAAALLCLAAMLAACSSGPPVPDWKLNAQSSVERFEAAYLDGNALIESTEFKRAREQVARTGQVDLVVRTELIRCATRVASLVFEDCAGYQQLAQDAGPADRAYASYLAGTLAPGAADIALLPEQHRAVAAATSDVAATAAAQAITDPLSQLVAAGVLLRSNRATPTLLATAVSTASAQGWRRPLLAWLGVQALRADQAGDGAEAQRIRRRIALVQSDASTTPPAAPATQVQP